MINSVFNLFGTISVRGSNMHKETYWRYCNNKSINYSNKLFLYFFVIYYKTQFNVLNNKLFLNLGKNNIIFN